MKKKEKYVRTHPVKIDQYAAAFKKFIGSGSELFEIKECWENGPMVALYKEEVYRIDNAIDMDKHFQDSLTYTEEAMNIPLEYWIDVAEDVHSNQKFVENLIEMLESKEELENLNLAYNLSKHASDSPIVFWEIINAIDDIGFYAKAIIAAGKTYNKESIIEELMEFMIADGENQFCQLQNGVFETIDLYEDDDVCTDNGIFYIYSVDSISWDTD